MPAPMGSSPRSMGVLGALILEMNFSLIAGFTGNSLHERFLICYAIRSVNLAIFPSTRSKYTHTCWCWGFGKWFYIGLLERVGEPACHSVQTQKFFFTRKPVDKINNRLLKENSDSLTTYSSSTSGIADVEFAKSFRKGNRLERSNRRFCG